MDILFLCLVHILIAYFLYNTYTMIEYDEEGYVCS